jgi:hypothetical protein
MATTREERSGKMSYKISDTYAGLRRMVFQLSSVASDKESRCERSVVAVVMEFARPNAVVSLVAVADGTASLYFSNGGGVLGGNSKSVRIAALDFVELAAHAYGVMEQANSYPFPSYDSVRFYIITSGCVLTAEVAEGSLVQNESILSRLFWKGNELISMIRKTTMEGTKGR